MQRLWIPGRLPGLNEIIAGARGAGRGTGREWQRQKKDWMYKIGLLARIQGLEQIGPSHFAWGLVEPNRKRDPSNVLAGAMKIVEDALQEAGFLSNDGWRHVRSVKVNFQVDMHEPGVLLVLYEHPDQMSQELDFWANLKIAKAGIHGANHSAENHPRGDGLGAVDPPGRIQGEAQGRA